MATVIGRDNARVAGAVIKAKVRDADELADTIVAQANAEASAIRLLAKREAQILIEETRTRLQVEAREDAKSELLASWIDWEAEREKRRGELQAQLIPLALKIGERLLGEALSLAPEQVRRAAEQAMACVPRARRLRLRAHPADLVHLKHLPADLLPDEDISPGGCVLITELGEVDARIEVRVATIAKALGLSPGEEEP